jgi:hypothetical protein
MNNINLAEQAYNAYSQATGNKNFMGNEMPKFNNLPENIKSAWNNAASEVIRLYHEVAYKPFIVTLAADRLINQLQIEPSPEGTIAVPAILDDVINSPVQILSNDPVIGPVNFRDAMNCMGVPNIVYLCGSTRFYEAFQKANFEETMKGSIVLSVGFYPHASMEVHGETFGIKAEEKFKLDELHKRKIDLCDEILVLNIGGYIGESTKSEIEHAWKTGKRIRYYEQPSEDMGK